MQLDQIVDLSFPLQGTTIPADHGYALYAAVSRHLPALHGDETVGIHPVRGKLMGQRLLALTRASCLVLRVPEAKIQELIPLAGQPVDVAVSRVVLGVPTIRPLRPTASLVSRLVVIRGFMDSGAFVDAARRQMAALEVGGSLSLLRQRSGSAVEGGTGSHNTVIRRTIRIHDKEVVGFAVGVEQLTAAESLRLQEAGIGGRRRFGCGVFVPWRR